MAINYSYPKIGALATGDLLTIVDISSNNRTNTLEIGDLSSYIITTSSLTNGSEQLLLFLNGLTQIH